MSSTVIQLKNISKTYQLGERTVKALDDVSATVESGEFVGVFGPSGSGKSTMLHIMSALDTPTSGEVYLADEGINEADENRLAEIRNKYVGFVFQFFNLVNHLNALENVALPLTVNGTPTKKRKERAKELLEKVGLGERLYHTPDQLSGGERQRVAIARALANDPEVIFLDEPTGNLDAPTGKKVMETIKELNDEGRTVVMATHDPSLVEYTSHYFRLESGRIAGIKEGEEK